MRLLTCLLFAGHAAAADVTGPTSGTFVPKPLAGHAIFDLRGGFGSGPAGPNGQVCVEVAPHRWVAVEACGTGGGFLYPEAGEEIMHLRAEGSFRVWQRGRAEGVVQPGLGMAEIQRGEDSPGFRFGPATEQNQRDAAGPEASVSTKGRWWVGDWAYLVGELSFGAAWIEAAPIVLEQDSAIVPFATGTFGVGF